MEFQLNESGFITKYLYSGKKETEFHDNNKDTNQLRYEKYLRNQVAKHEKLELPVDIKLGENSDLGMPWKYYYSYGNAFLDDSSFYIELRRIDLYAVTELVAEEDMEVSAYLWSYSAVDLWLNGQLTATLQTPVYKPINRVDMKLKLVKGKNRIFVRLETLGVRDTRISFAIQVLDHKKELRVTLPDEEGIEPYVNADEILNSAVLTGNRLVFADYLPVGSYLSYDKEDIDFRKLKDRLIREDVSACSEIQLKDYAAFRIEICVGSCILKRKFERIELRTAKYLNTTKENNRETVFEKIAEIASILREETDGFALYPMLARYHLGQRTAEDVEEFNTTLHQIERRMDCADFMVCALIRFIKNYEISKELEAEVKRVMLNFRYWMDEDGQDGMCFWSENHSLMFYQAAYFFGMEYPGEIFLRSGRTGEEMTQRARLRLNEWLTDVCEQGYDEFNSGVYSPITFAAVLNLVDYAETDLAAKAEKAADILVKTFALHCFKNVIISPQGRVYRDVLYPHLQALQSIVQLIRPEAPYVYSEWLVTLATSKYRLPEDLSVIMERQGAFTYNSSNAVIELYKTKDYILTSVQSPRRDGRTRVWESNRREEDREKFIYTKSLNECFHGTTQFEPGVFGYQQHLWYAAVDPELVVFTNHPGSTCEDMPEVRPGYWYGNGILPAIRQDNNVLGVIYVIPDTHPIDFTHLYWNERKFSETLSKGNWLFGRKDTGYIAVWCSTSQTDYNDVLFACEKRAYGNKIAYLCVLGSEQENGSFEVFVNHCLSRKVQFEQEKNTLTSREFELTFEEHKNMSQYVE